MKKVTKAIIPAAGLGTRMLPISCAVPKEMLPIVDLPAVAYLVEEAVNAGITDILIITNRGKDAIENFFDYPTEYEKVLREKGRLDEIARLHRIADAARISFVRQKEAKGLGHAVLCGEAFAGSDPFAVLYGDDVIVSQTPVTAQLIRAYEKTGLPVAGVRAVSSADLSRYCSLKVEPTGDEGIFHCTDMVEKPKEGRAFSNYAILGRVLLESDVFPILKALPAGAGGEIQLTDAMAEVARRRGMTACAFEGDRYDIGSKLGFLQANVIEGVKHPEVGESFRTFLKEFAAKL